MTDKDAAERVKWWHVLAAIVALAVVLGGFYMGWKSWQRMLADEPPIRVRNGSLYLQLPEGAAWQDLQNDPVAGSAWLPHRGTHRGHFWVRVKGTTCTPKTSCCDGERAFKTKALKVAYSGSPARLRLLTHFMRQPGGAAEPGPAGSNTDPYRRGGAARSQVGRFLDSQTFRGKKASKKRTVPEAKRPFEGERPKLSTARTLESMHEKRRFGREKKGELFQSISISLVSYLDSRR